MKVVLVNTVYGTGSTGKIVTDLYETIEQSKHTAFCVYGRGGMPNEINGYKTGSKMDFYKHVCRNFFLGENGFGSEQKTIQLIKKLREYEPDLIHLHNIHGFYLQVEILFQYIKEAKIPVVWTLHDCYPYTGHCAYYDKNRCNQFLEGCPKCRYHRSAYPYAIFRDNAAESFQRKKKAFTGVENLTIVTPSKWLAEEVKKSFLQEYSVRTIENGIDLELFKPNQEKKRLPQFEILGVANVWEERKGLAYFEALARKLPKQYHITLIGLSTRQKRRLEKSIGGERILARGRTGSQEELAEAYRKADVFVNPTLEDNFPTTNLEALACGTPVITFRTGGSPETIDSFCGIVVEKGNQKALEEAIRQVQAHPFFQRDCRKRAELFDKTIQYQKYIALYKEILGKEKQ